MSVVAAVTLCLLAAGNEGDSIAMPGGDRGIGFDDLGYSSKLGKVLVPSGATGRVNLVDPKTGAVESISGFSAGAGGGQGHGEGTTSADVGGGFLFASDRTRKTLSGVDLATRKIVATAQLQGGPDYVRWVGPTSEVWVTEPGRKAIEIFRFTSNPAPALTSVASITFPDGPESLVIDATRGRAYTHSWKDTTFAVDLKARAVAATWNNGCQGARGIGLDEPRGWLFVGCDEGQAVSLDVVHGGAKLGAVKTAKGVDIIAYSAALGHLYVPGGDDAQLTTVGVGKAGALTSLGTAPTAPDAHCVATDGAGTAFICDPQHGRVLRIRDPYPASAR
ncbi:MAG TPA: hypothetical protein VFA20_15180 [Myxococcaceae bacterium]|nr:hypothetical protein [Myxococcaceae bacterium]